MGSFLLEYICNGRVTLWISLSFVVGLEVLGSNSFHKGTEMDGDGEDKGFWFCEDGRDERSNKDKSLYLSSMNDVLS